MDPSNRPADDDARLALAIVLGLLAGAAVSRARAGAPPAAPPRLARHLVDLDAAPAGEIESLPGVGRVLAQRIVAGRAEGPYRSADDLSRVPGVGAATIERLRGFVRERR